MKKKKNSCSFKKVKHTDSHHIYPTSRRPDLKNKRFNIIDIDMGKHRVYHQLFSNKTPPEIIEYLVKYFWRDNWMAIREVKDKVNQLYYSHKRRLDPNQIKIDFNQEEDR